MPVELVGQQVRIQVKRPVKGAIYRTHDVGKKKRLQRIAMKVPGEDWETQSWRLNLASYEDVDDALADLEMLAEREITKKQYEEAKKIIEKWFR